MSDSPDLEVVTHSTWFERRHHTHEHTELEVEVSYDIEAETLSDLVLAADARAAELAEGRPWYVYRLNAEETHGGLEAEVTAYISVPRALAPDGRASSG
jgi:hypothetical protein